MSEIPISGVRFYDKPNVREFDRDRYYSSPPVEQEYESGLSNEVDPSEIDQDTPLWAQIIIKILMVLGYLSIFILLILFVVFIVYVKQKAGYQAIKIDYVKDSIGISMLTYFFILILFGNWMTICMPETTNHTGKKIGYAFSYVYKIAFLFLLLAVYICVFATYAYSTDNEAISVLIIVFVAIFSASFAFLNYGRIDEFMRNVWNSVKTSAVKSKSSLEIEVGDPLEIEPVHSPSTNEDDIVVVAERKPERKPELEQYF